MKLAAPMIGGRRSASASVFNEGVSVPQADWDRITARNPALVSKDVTEKSEAMRKAILQGELRDYRRR